MTIQVFSNQASSQLAGSISAGATSITLNAGGGASFPTISAGQVFYATLYDAATKLAREIVLVTGRSGDVLTVLRGQDGTTAQSWLAGDFISQWLTRAVMNNLTQQAQVQAGSYNVATDVGSANLYSATMTPSLSAYPPGMPFTLFPVASNTGASTVNLGPGAIPIINPDGTSLGSNTLLAGGAYPMVTNAAGTAAILTGASQSLQGSGLATTGDVKWRPTQETITGWVGDTSTNGMTIGSATSGATYANANAAALFNWAWTNFSNTQCPVSGGRGVSNTADFAANKTITMPDMRGLTMGGLDVGGSTNWASVPTTIGNSTTPGSIIGENLHALITAELAAHTHGVIDFGHGHVVPADFDTRNQGTVSGFGYYTNTGSNSPLSASNNVTGISIANAGSGTAHNTTQRTMLGTFYFKL
jgi:hypothetical protein